MKRCVAPVRRSVSRSVTPGTPTRPLPASRLTDRRTGATQRFTTFSDGAFYVLGVKPGDYDLAVDSAVLDALQATAVPLRVTLAPTANGVGASGLEVELRPKP